MSHSRQLSYWVQICWGQRDSRCDGPWTQEKPQRPNATPGQESTMQGLPVSPASLQGAGVAHSPSTNSLGIQMGSDRSSSKTAQVCAQVSPLSHGPCTRVRRKRTGWSALLSPPRGPHQDKGIPSFWNEDTEAACPWAPTVERGRALEPTAPCWRGPTTPCFRSGPGPRGAAESLLVG